jgi:hypothetical protein
MALPLNGSSVPTTKHITSEGKERIGGHLRIASKIAGERLAEERYLYTTKWFDYRFLSPLAATELFASEYQKIFRRTWEATFDREEAAKKQGLRKGGIYAGGGELTSIWRARQAADALGLPYEFFIAKAMDAATGRGARHLPRPNQLYHEWNCQRALAAWGELIDARFRPSELPQYRNEAFCGHHAQIAHRKWVVDRIKARSMPSYLIGRSCFILKVLPVEIALSEFGADRVKQAHTEVADDMPVDHMDLRNDDFWPACMGVPHAHASEVEPCVSCRQQSACYKIGKRLVAKLRETHGSEDPVLTQKRADTAARVRKHREKKKQMKLGKSKPVVELPVSRSSQAY